MNGVGGSAALGAEGPAYKNGVGGSAALGAEGPAY